MAQIPIQNFHPHEPVFVKSNQVSHPPVLEVDSVEDHDNPNKFDNILIQNVITWTEKKKNILSKRMNSVQIFSAINYNPPCPKTETVDCHFSLEHAEMSIVNQQHCSSFNLPKAHTNGPKDLKKKI